MLRYEIGFCGQVNNEEGGVTPLSFDTVADMFDQRIKEICSEVWATEEPILYLTMDRRLHKKQNKQRKKEGKEEVEYKPNFRDQVAKEKVYKGTRKSEKPFHYDNLTAYILGKYEVKVAEGFEADDLLSIDQRKRLDKLDTIICSRDKDLRITPGMHFSWSCGKQAQWGPARVTELGELELKGDKKLVGNGLKFFYAQVIMGDPTDNIPGLPRGGPVLAFKTLEDCSSELEMFEKVSSLYKGVYGEEWRPKMREQVDLTWMIQELTEEGEPVRYVMPDERNA